ncbi:MAG TPA: hypothetical protein DCX06_10855 [Opitutae bacterium]|nr:hypothetical protein [Opitutae bacterium]
MKRINRLVTIAMALASITFATGQHHAEKATMEATALSLEEWRSFKYGMFIHFGMATYASRPNENHPKNAQEPSALYAPTDLDVDQWIRVARDSGMNYAVLTAKHSAGHCLWDSKVQFRGKEFDHDIATSGNKTDVVAAFVEACEKYAVAPGLYWCLFDCRNNSVRPGLQWEKGDLPDDYFQFTQEQLAELLNNYPEVEYLWIDIPRAASLEERTEIYNGIKEINPACVVLMNHGLEEAANASIANYQAAWPTDILNTERHPLNVGQFETKQTWEGEEYELGYEHCDTICKKWFWYEGDQPRPVEDLYALYKQTTEAGGNLLLNVPPDQSGRIPDYHVNALMEIKMRIDASVKISE